MFLDVLGLGVLITGESGLGKSELALELISRGHGLVADDAVEFSRTALMIEGHCPQLLQNLLEVRGLGLLDIRTIFGETSVRRKMRLKLIVHLVRATAQDKFERLPLQDITQDMLGLPVRKVMLQVAAGRNLAVLVEAAVRNTILKLRGIDTLGEFMERQAMAILQAASNAIRDRQARALGPVRHLAAEIEKSIRDGVLRGDKLPSVRDACSSRGVSPSTVFQAYYLLEARGLIRARPRSGYT